MLDLSKMRSMTDEERKIYNNTIKKLARPTGRNIFSDDREKRLKDHFAALSLEKLRWFKEQYEIDAELEMGLGFDYKPSLEKVQWIKEEIEKRNDKEVK